MLRDLRTEMKVNHQDPDSVAACAYKMLPLNSLSRAWGKVHDVDLPVWSRTALLGAYVKVFGCDLNEAVVQDLKEFRNLGELFRRSLKKEVRPIDRAPKAVVSPCDGKVLHLGQFTFYLQYLRF